MNNFATLHISLEIAGSPPQEAKSLRDKSYDAELDNVLSIIDDVCDSLADWGGVTFVVSGFGEKWPVDVRTDLAVVMQQLATFLQDLYNRKEAELDFYEQGISRCLMITRDDKRVVINCFSSTPWLPKPHEVEMTAHEFVLMLTAFRTAFVELLVRRAPSQARHTWMKEWLVQTETVLEKLHGSLAHK